MVFAFRKNKQGISKERDTAMERETLTRPRGRTITSTESELAWAALEPWIRQRLKSIDHEARVRQIATSLFDLTADLHGLDSQASAALAAAALAHDVGRSIDPDQHARIGAELILTDAALALPSAARRCLAYLTLYHRGPVAALGEDEILRATDDREGLRKLLGLLRAADTLDSRSLETPRLLLMRQDRRIQIWCFVREPSERAQKAFCRPKKYRLLEETLDCTVEVDVRNADARMLPGAA